MTKEQEQQQELITRWEQASHAMQSGVAMEMQIAEDKHAVDPREPATDSSVRPKHLRVGINNALCDHAALVHLLIKKGVFTELEYLEAIVVEMEAEKKRYEDRLSEIFKTKITLR